MSKLFAIPGEQMRELVEMLGGCLITDRVTVDRQPIGYMYRAVATEPADTGWRFFAGDETPEYVDDLGHTGVYAVNTAANYDPDIIPFLEVEAPCAFEKVRATYRRVEVFPDAA